MIKVTFSNLETLTSADLNTNFVGVLDVNVYNEDQTALVQVPPARLTFPTAFKFKPNTTRVYLSTPPSPEMTRKRPGVGNDYVENLDISGNGISVSFAVAPLAGATLLLDYQKANI